VAILWDRPKYQNHYITLSLQGHVQPSPFYFSKNMRSSRDTWRKNRSYTRIEIPFVCLNLRMIPSAKIGWGEQGTGYSFIAFTCHRTFPWRTYLKPKASGMYNLPRALLVRNGNMVTPPTKDRWVAYPVFIVCDCL